MGSGSGLHGRCSLCGAGRQAATTAPLSAGPYSPLDADLCPIFCRCLRQLREQLLRLLALSRAAKCYSCVRVFFTRAHGPQPPVMSCAISDSITVGGMPDGLIRLWRTEDVFASALTGTSHGRSCSKRSTVLGSTVRVKP